MESKLTNYPTDTRKMDVQMSNFTTTQKSQALVATAGILLRTVSRWTDIPDSTKKTLNIVSKCCLLGSAAPTVYKKVLTSDFFKTLADRFIN